MLAGSVAVSDVPDAKAANVPAPKNEAAIGSVTTVIAAEPNDVPVPDAVNGTALTRLTEPDDVPVPLAVTGRSSPPADGSRPGKGDSPLDNVVPVNALRVDVPTRSAGVVCPSIHKFVMPGVVWIASMPLIMLLICASDRAVENRAMHTMSTLSAGVAPMVMTPDDAYVRAAKVTPCAACVGVGHDDPLWVDLEALATALGYERSAIRHQSPVGNVGAVALLLTAPS